MSYSVQTDVVDVARLVYPDLSPTDAVKYLNIIRGEVLRRLKLYATTSTISLTAGTQEYALSAGIDRVEAVEYRRSATQSDFMPVLPVSLDYLEQQETRFRAYTNGEPRRFYLSEGTTGPLIGFVPAPLTSTSSGYPIITLYEQAFTTLIVSDTFYDDLPSCLVYTTGVAREFSKANAVDQYQMRDALYQQALNEAQDYLFKKNKNLQITMRGAWIKPRGVI